MEKIYRYDNDSLPSFSNFAYSDVWAYTDSMGREFAVLGSLDSVHFFEVTPGIIPYQFYNFKAGGRSLWREFKSYKNYIYAIADQPSTQEGLVVFDVKNSPDSIAFVYRDDTSFHRAHMLFVDTLNALLYITGSSRNNGMESWDLLLYNLWTDPSKPTLIKRIQLPGDYVHDVYVNNDTAFCSHGFNGLYVYRFDSLGNFTTLGSIDSYPEVGYNHSSWMSKDKKHLVWADETHNTGLKLADISDPSRIMIKSIFRSTLLAPTHINSIGHNPYYRDSLIISSYYHDGIQIWNASNPTNVFRIAYYDTEPQDSSYAGYSGAWGVYPFLPSGNMLVSDVKNGLFLLSMNFSLPLEILSFYAVKKNKAHELKLNLNVQQFAGSSITIQKSKDGKIFYDLHTFKDLKNQLVFNDTKDLEGKNYYRWTWSENGHRSYSMTKELYTNPDELKWLQVGERTFVLQSPSDIPRHHIKLYNFLNVIYETDVKFDFTVPDHIPDGIYFLESKKANGIPFVQKIAISSN